MSETITSDPLAASEKPVPVGDGEKVEFPPFPEPTDDAFEDDILEEERTYYKNKFPDLNAVKNEKLHCSACDRHLGCSARNESRMRVHPMLRTLVCHTCHTFYNSGEFDKGDDGSELYCRWCGQGGQVYCCSDCPIVFCAKCIKRNFGMPKIREIENTDDWKCFKCNPRCLWDLRAVCWALLRYCDQRNKIAYKTEDAELKQAYQKACSVDDSGCCKAKINKKKEKEAKRKEPDGVKEFQRAAANKAATAINAINVMTKIPPSIQVKKFASINLDESPPKEKKAHKRQAEKDKVNILKHPIPVNKVVSPVTGPPLPKKMRISNVNLPSQMPTVKFQKNYQSSYSRIRPKAPPPVTPMPMTILNNYINKNLNTMMNNYTNDNINLSLENLTQGLDMTTMAGLPGMSDSDVVCTPDFPLEPLCEVMEENQDDDVECITPASHMPSRAPPLVPLPRAPPPPPPPVLARALPDINPDNIIQMTEHDVTVNAATGGLKFRVDPQTLSANKMYRLPDGRVFAINPNPNMPGGYSATIVALSDSSKMTMPKGPTYAAKLNPVSAAQTPSPTPRRPHTPPPAPAPAPAPARVYSSRRSARADTSARRSDSSSRSCDLRVPVEWFRYNLIDAVDALEYSLSKLHRLKKDATTMFLRSRTVDEMRNLHKTLDGMLKTSACRFNEIRDNLNKEMKQYAKKKKTASIDNISDDDDVEILNDVNDDPIFIDENSMDSLNANETNGNVTNEVDLTGPASSDHNDSVEKTTDNVEKDPLLHNELSNDNSVDGKKDGDADKAPSEVDHNDLQENSRDGNFDTAKDMLEMNGDIEQFSNKERKKDTEKNYIKESNDKDKIKPDEHVKKAISESLDDSMNHEDGFAKEGNDSSEDKAQNNDASGNKDEDTDIEHKAEDEEVGDKEVEDKDVEDKEVEDKEVEDKDTNASELNMDDVEMSQDKIQDTDMTEELIDSLLKDDNTGDGETTNLSCMDIPEDFPEP